MMKAASGPYFNLAKNQFKISSTKGQDRFTPKSVLQSVHLPRRLKTSLINWFVESRPNPYGPLSKMVPNWLDSDTGSVMVYQEQFLVDPSESQTNPD